MMNGLEIPLEFAGQRVHRNNRVAEQIIARPIAAPIIAGGGAERHVQDAAPLIESHVPAPDVDAGSFFPAVIQPGFVSGLAWAGDRMEFPDLGSRSRIE